MSLRDAWKEGDCVGLGNGNAGHFVRAVGESSGETWCGKRFGDLWSAPWSADHTGYICFSCQENLKVARRSR